MIRNLGTVLLLLVACTFDPAVDCSEQEVVKDIISSTRPNMGSREIEFWTSLIQDTARKQRISFVLFAATIAIESKFRSHLVSPKGATGVTQLMPINYRDCKIDPTEIEPNMDCGARTLAKAIDVCKGAYNGLRCYNGPPSPYSLKVPETKTYADQVMLIISTSVFKKCRVFKGLESI